MELNTVKLVSAVTITATSSEIRESKTELRLDYVKEGESDTELTKILLNGEEIEVDELSASNFLSDGKEVVFSVGFVSF